MWRYLDEHGLGRFVRVVLGWFFIALGLVGLVLPVLQGFLFLAIGALLLAPYVPFFRRMKILLYRRFPRVRRTVEKMNTRVRTKLHLPPRRRRHLA